MRTGENPYKILVLSDLKKNTHNLLKSALSLSEVVGASVELFHVKSASNIVGSENQLSAMRSINKEYIQTENKLKKVVKHFSEEHDGIHISYSFAFGSVKDKIGKRIKEFQPDIVVLGKRKRNPLRLMGDSITQFVLKFHKGSVFIASNDAVLDSKSELFLGFLNGTSTDLKSKFVQSLIRKTRFPLTSFKILKNSTDSPKDTTFEQQTINEYVFEENDYVIKNLSRYLSKNNINVLCVHREHTEAVQKLNASLFVLK